MDFVILQPLCQGGEDVTIPRLLLLHMHDIGRMGRGSVLLGVAFL